MKLLHKFKCQKCGYLVEFCYVHMRWEYSIAVLMDNEECPSFFRGAKKEGFHFSWNERYNHEIIPVPEISKRKWKRLQKIAEQRGVDPTYAPSGDTCICGHDYYLHNQYASYSCEVLKCDCSAFSFIEVIK